MSLEKLKINFILPPCELSGGPLAILEYANRLSEKGHDVSVTTYPKEFWPQSWGATPFPWFNFNGKYIFPKEKLHSKIWNLFYRVLNKVTRGKKYAPLLLKEFSIVFKTSSCIPECDLNIATFWSTAFAAFFSQKGKPVYFMQHYEEVFYTNEFSNVLSKLVARMSYELPIYKVANSSWLQQVIKDKYRQKVPFSNNGIELSDFNPAPKLSEQDGIIRIVTFSRQECWKGFADAVEVMKRIKQEYNGKVEWQVFGRPQSYLPAENTYAPYTLFQGLPFSDLAQLYAQADIALCPSWYESFPLPPLEAMASGTATVTTSYGVEDYAFDGKNALVVMPRDIDAMYSSVKKLIESESLRNELALEGRKTAKKFDWGQAVDAREKILLDIAKGEVDYNIFEPLNTNFTDVTGTSFEKIPQDVDLVERSLVRFKGDIFIIMHGCKRHILKPELLPQGLEIVDIDPLTFSRIPSGFSIRSKYDA